MEMFKAKAQISKKSAKEILLNDFKDFQFKSGKFGIGQIEMPDLGELEPKIPELKSLMAEMQKQGYHTLILIMTDVVQEGSKLLVVSKDEKKIAKLFKTDLEHNATGFLAGVMSRKKQVMPVLSENF